jgi:hypothetical protein
MNSCAGRLATSGEAYLFGLLPCPDLNPIAMLMCKNPDKFTIRELQLRPEMETMPGNDATKETHRPCHTTSKCSWLAIFATVVIQLIPNVVCACSCQRYDVPQRFTSDEIIARIRVDRIDAESAWVTVVRIYFGKVARKRIRIVAETSCHVSLASYKKDAEFVVSLVESNKPRDFIIPMCSGVMFFVASGLIRVDANEEILNMTETQFEAWLGKRLPAASAKIRNKK